MTATHLVVGPTRHGVVSFALELGESLRRRDPTVVVARVEDCRHLDEAVAGINPVAGVHLNFTDRLFGAGPSEAAARVVSLVRQVGSTGARVTATMHDVPQPCDGGNYRQRVSAYAAVCAALHGVATNSEHERSLLAESRVIAPGDVCVVPLPLHLAGPAPRRPAVGGHDVAVLGFVYPGKGHAEVLAAMSGLPSSVGFVAVGQCSDGHDDVARRLATSARRADRQFSITGWVPTRELPDVLRRMAVPVAHHRHVSASGSINTWIAAHRRPLVPRNRYTVEHSRRHPGTLQMYPDTTFGLAEAIECALDEPDSTWIAPATAGGWSSTDATASYARILAEWHG